MRRWTTPTTSNRSSAVDRDVAEAWAVVASGALGPQWYVDAAPWVLRGGIDRLVGGRGRAHRPPGRALLETGDRVGFWRVDEADHAAHHLVLVAEVRAPGTVELTTTVVGDGRGGSRVTQTVRLRPSGLLGVAYLAVDLPAREVVIELAHRRLVADIDAQASTVPPVRQ